jgi:hypothetical protein
VESGLTARLDRILAALLNLNGSQSKIDALAGQLEVLNVSLKQSQTALQGVVNNQPKEK